MPLFNFILWSVSPEIFSVGPVTVRWYGLLFALGFLLGQQILIYIYKKEGRSEKNVETLTIYMVVATIIGARLGHCLFYEPDYYLKHPLDILKIWEGGLASHGATIGILLAIYIYSKKNPGQSYIYVLDRMVITIALAGCLIRLGNLMNSEIIGKPTNFPGAFLFTESTESRLALEYDKIVDDISITKNQMDTSMHGQIYAGLNLNFRIPGKDIPNDAVNNFVQNNLKETLTNYPDIQEHIFIPDGDIDFDLKKDNEGGLVTAKIYGIPRHASQLYEALSCIVLFVVLFLMWNRKKAQTPDGRIFGLFLVILFSLRFLYEFFKEPQVAFENSMSLNMGQLLSIPLIIAGIFIVMRSYKKKNEIT